MIDSTQPRRSIMLYGVYCRQSWHLRFTGGDQNRKVRTIATINRIYDYSWMFFAATFPLSSLLPWQDHAIIFRFASHELTIVYAKNYVISAIVLIIVCRTTFGKKYFNLQQLKRRRIFETCAFLITLSWINDVNHYLFCPIFRHDFSLLLAHMQ